MVERCVVVAMVAGSNPVCHPSPYVREVSKQSAKLCTSVRIRLGALCIPHLNAEGELRGFDPVN
jgi:hypothetical protein